MVLGTAVLLVFGVARVLGGGSDGSSTADDDEAVQAAATPPPDRPVLPRRLPG